MQIVPIRDLRNTNEISERCKQSAEPIFITKNGYGDMVIMSMETYERTVAMAEVYRKLYDLAHTDPQWMHTAPHHAQTRRPDEVRAARNPILRYDPS